MSHIRLAGRFGIPVIALLLLCAAAFSAGPARAQSADTFSVRNIDVDVTAANAGAARDQALIEGQRQAFQILMQRLTAPADQARLPKLGDKDLQNIVLDVGIDREKLSSVRCIATLSVRFKAEAVRQFLRANDVAYVEWRGRPVVVIPVWQTESGPVLGQAPNPWRDAWRSGAAQGVVPLVTPSPEQTNSVLTPAQAATAGTDVLTAVGARFNTREVLIAVAQEQKDDSGKLSVNITVNGIGVVAPLVTGAHPYAGDIGEPEDMLLRRAVADLARTINDGFKNGNLLQYEKSGTLAVTVPLDGSLSGWTEVREKLFRTAPVRSYEVSSLSRKEADLVLHFVGGQDQLQTQLAQNGLLLNRIDDRWELTNAPDRPAAGMR